MRGGIGLWELGRAVFLGTMTGVLGTGAGGLILSFFGRPKDQLLSFLLAFSAGVMLAVTFQDLIMEAISLGGLGITLLGITLGVLTLFLFTSLISAKKIYGTKLAKTGLLLGLGIALHNLPEGLAIGAGYLASENLGLSLALALCIHNIPEGMAMAAPLLAGGLSSTKTVLWTILAGIPMGLGATIGGLFGTLNAPPLAGALGFAAGAMLFLVFQELLPQAQNPESPASSTSGAIFGIVLGLVFLTLL